MSAAPSPPSPAVLREAASRALGEDRGPADMTSLATIPEHLECEAVILTREPCVLAGLVVARQVFVEESLSMEMKDLARDGDHLNKGDGLISLRGPARAILSAERSALNFLQQLSAVATRTRQFVEAVAGTSTKILDTRKTIPGLRELQKYAVRCGGGHNHRMGLFDAFLIKDNHLALMGEPGNWAVAIHEARCLDPDLLLEVEADTVDQVRKLAELDVDRILLDNMDCEQIRQCVDIVSGRKEIEVSGGMTLERCREVAECGVDYISVGALTHTLAALDMSLDVTDFPQG